MCNVDISSYLPQARQSTPRTRKAPPRPAKIFPSVRRIASGQTSCDHAQVISFKLPANTSQNSSLLSASLDTSLAANSSATDRLTLVGYDDSKKESYFEQMFTNIQAIGSGDFGTVWSALWRYDHKYYAIKRSKTKPHGKNERERRLQEVAKHENLPKHPNLVEFIQAWEEKSHLYIQMELCECTLAEYIERNPQPSEATIWSFLVDLLMAVAHLHDHNLIHLDIKPENIFIKDGICKLGDFGLVYDLNDSSSTYEPTEGDPKYMARELMAGIFTKSADIFSVGITILEISCDLDLPSNGEGFHSLRSGQIPFDSFDTCISRGLKNVISCMMSPHHLQRPSARDLLSHPHIRYIFVKRLCKIRLNRFCKIFKDLLIHFLTIIFVVSLYEHLVSLLGYKSVRVKTVQTKASPSHHFSGLKAPDHSWDRDSTPDAKLQSPSLVYDYYTLTDDEDSRCITPLLPRNQNAETPVLPLTMPAPDFNDESGEDHQVIGRTRRLTRRSINNSSSEDQSFGNSSVESPSVFHGPATSSNLYKKLSKFAPKNRPSDTTSPVSDRVLRPRRTRISSSDLFIEPQVLDFELPDD